jgi:hypothetical protein
MGQNRCGLQFDEPQVKMRLSSLFNLNVTNLIYFRIDIEAHESIRDLDLVVDEHGMHSQATWMIKAKASKELLLQNLLNITTHQSYLLEDDDVMSVASTCAGEEGGSASRSETSALPRHGTDGHPSCWNRIFSHIGDPGRFSDLCMPQLVCASHTPLHLKTLCKGPQIGRGSSGVVWRGTDPAAAPGCAFAVKEMPLPAADGDEGRRRGVLNEIRVAYRADHPNVVTCYEVRFLPEYVPSR